MLNLGFVNVTYGYVKRQNQFYNSAFVYLIVYTFETKWTEKVDPPEEKHSCSKLI
jgi:hypothetical protein